MINYYFFCVLSRISDLCGCTRTYPELIGLILGLLFQRFLYGEKRKKERKDLLGKLKLREGRNRF